MITVAFDSFFHMPPGLRVGRHIASAGMRHNFGRYHPDDCYHFSASDVST